jgi:hypothetical protein
MRPNWHAGTPSRSGVSLPRNQTCQRIMLFSARHCATLLTSKSGQRH